MQTVKIPENLADVTSLMLDQLCKRKGWLHSDLAAQLGVGRTTATRIIGGQQAPTVVQLWMLLDRDEWTELLDAMDAFGARLALEREDEAAGE